MRLDLALVQRGLTRSRSRAATLISDGRVLINGKTITKASVKVLVDDVVSLAGDGAEEYASRASYKLLRTLEAISDQLNVSGRLALDVGASTGGFTDVLLRNGAANVVALDVGHDQLVDELRSDPRVTVIEDFNARLLTRDALPYAPDLLVCDVSFISISLILEPMALSAADEADFLLMIKPQFEVGPSRVGAGGVVRDLEARAGAVEKILTQAVELGLAPTAVIPSALPGPNGNHEFFVWLKKRSATMGDSRSCNTESIQRAVHNAIHMSADGDMISDAVEFPVVKGMPENLSVPHTTVYWI